MRNILGFTLVELMVVITIISILSGVVFASFNLARQGARDDVRQTDLKQLQLALQLYRAQNGRYPAAGCSTAAGTFTATTCAVYIVDLAPEFISRLPQDPSGNYYRYQTNSAGDSYKVMTENVERKRISSFNDEFARCPSAGGGCGTTVPTNTYAVFGGPNSSGW